MDEYQNPSEACDLVMKGGITSGVVYPQAVLALAEKYRFRSLGGGSVGAIAAALTAAAEKGRRNGAFTELKKEQTKLQREDFLLEVFRPTETARPLMDTLLEFAKVHDSAKKEGRKVWVAILRSLAPILIRNRPASFAIGVLGGVVLSVAAVFLLAIATASALNATGLYISMLVVGLVLGFVGGLLWAARSILNILRRKLPTEEHYYGMCIGHADTLPPDQHPPLGDWLSGLFDRLACKEDGRPLTFKDLKAERATEQADTGVELKMLTTNLSHGEPYVFPRAFNTFVFKEEDMRRFFPGYVVDYMVEEAADNSVQLPEGFHFLPEGGALPVIVPVRMAVSFPILLCAVPMYTIKASSRAASPKQPDKLTKNDLQLNWFSDGGICSNFPIHFFDAWLPQHPTFGINLTTLPESWQKTERSVSETRGQANSSRAQQTSTPDAPEAEASTEDVWLPRPDDPDNPEWKSFRGLAGFAMAIFHSAQNYRDNMQSRLPSYQERIVQVRLGKEEGGLNLGMDVDTLNKLVDRGQRAGEKLRDGEFQFDHHRWARLRVLMHELEAQLHGTRVALGSVISAGLMDEQLGNGYPYPLDEDRVEEAKNLLLKLQDLVDYLEQSYGQSAASAAEQIQFHFPPVTKEELQPTLRITPDV
jgi:predicted acylesterase/phospholipase RssA